MIEINTKKVELKVDGKEYILTLPTQLEYIDYKEGLKEAGEDERKIYNSISKFLSRMGMPSEDIDKLEASVLNRILEEIIIASSKKN